MKKITTIIVFLCLVLFFVAGDSFAAESRQGTETGDFVNSLPLWVAVIVGAVASGMVLLNAKKIGGGVLSQTYYFFGTGMSLVVLGFLSVVIPPWASPFVIARVHDISFVAGYVFMAIGARKMITAANLK